MWLWWSLTTFFNNAISIYYYLVLFQVSKLLDIFYSIPLQEYQSIYTKKFRTSLANPLDPQKYSLLIF
jgi:hypothetical protein